jgi:hypothetical protein
MSICYTTGWAQKQTNTLERWQSWVNSLKNGDRCIFQEFIPRGNFCLDSQVECWRFYDAKFLGDRVLYDGETKPLSMGYASYYGSGERWGDVFPARVVPWHSDINPSEGRRFKDCHAPVFDENWTPREMHRHLVLTMRSGPKRYPTPFEQIQELFSYCYERKVSEGKLITIFGDWECITAEKINQIEGARYLYSEPLSQ